MLHTFDVGFVSRWRRGRGLLMLDVARNTGHNMGEEGERLLMLDVARNVLGTCSQHLLAGL
jgi:hypothetical protein